MAYTADELTRVFIKTLASPDAAASKFVKTSDGKFIKLSALEHTDDTTTATTYTADTTP